MLARICIRYNIYYGIFFFFWANKRKSLFCEDLLSTRGLLENEYEIIKKKNNNEIFWRKKRSFSLQVIAMHVQLPKRYTRIIQIKKLLFSREKPLSRVDRYIFDGIVSH